MTGRDISNRDRRAVARVFRSRLRTIIARSGLASSAFARSIALDRSTLAQLLDEDGDRLPRAETLTAIAAVWKISVDWLIGVTEKEAAGADIIETILQIETHEPLPADELFLRWHQEAAGRRVRTIPRSFPDMLKTPDVIRFEYASSLGSDPEKTLQIASERLALLRRPETDLESCVAIQALTGFARGEQAWEGLDAETRRAQLLHMAALCDELYPSYRLFLYDLRRTYSAPFTLFGSTRAAIYLGQSYFIFSASAHIIALMRRFDELVRSATVQPPDVPGLLVSLAGEI